MAEEDFISAKDRLEQAKKEAIWLVGVSNDLARHTQDYNLTPEEQDVLLLESQKHLVEIKEAVSGVRIEGIPAWPDPELTPLPQIPTWPDPDLRSREETQRGRAERDNPAP